MILEEKRRKREEAKRAADEARKKKKGTNAAPESPVDDTNIIDNLLKEIRAGTTLRPTSTQLKRHRPSLKTAELEKLKKIAEVATSPTYKSPSSSLQRNFNFPVSRDPVDMIVEEATRQMAEEAAQKKAAGPGTVEPSQDVPLVPTTPPDQTAPPTTPPDQTAPPTTYPSSTPVIKPALTVNQNGEPEADTKQNGELEVADQLQPPSDGGESVKEEEPRVKVAVWDEEKVENGIDSSPTRQVRQLFLYSHLTLGLTSPGSHTDFVLLCTLSYRPKRMKR